MNKKDIIIKTKGQNDIIDITQEVRIFVEEAKISDGVVLVFVPGTTAGVTTMEYEDGLLKDTKDFFESIVPRAKKYQHDLSHVEGNGFSHLRASLLSTFLMVPFSDNELSLGTWQQVVIMDFDVRPRDRKIILRIIAE